MTVICYRDGVISCDGRVQIEDMIITDSLKKIAKGDGVIGGFSGDADAMGENLRWIKETNGDWTKFPKGKCNGIVVFADSGKYKIFMVDDGAYYEIPDGYYTRGSGRECAMAFMDAGMSARDAVRMTIKRISSTGGKIFVEKL